MLMPGSSPAGPGIRCEVVCKSLGGAAKLSGSLAVLPALRGRGLAESEVDSRLGHMDHSRQIVPGIVEGSNDELVTLGHDFRAALGRHDLADPLAVVRRDQILNPFPERRLLPRPPRRPIAATATTARRIQQWLRDIDLQWL